MRPEHERDLDRTCPDPDGDIPDGRTAVGGGEPVRRIPNMLDHERITDECFQLRAAGHCARPTRFVSQRRPEPELGIREHGTGRLDRGLTRAPFSRVREDPVLRCPQTDDGRCRDAEREDRQDKSLSAIVPHGVHSIERAASPRTTNAGKPMNDNGADSA